MRKRVMQFMLGYVILCQTVTGQETLREFRFGRLTVEDGLPRATVLAALQDQIVFLWFATADGLSRYDGDMFVTYRHERANPNSLSHDTVRTVLLDELAGVVWAGTAEGLNRYDLNAGQWQTYTVHDGLGSDNITGIQSGNDDSLWGSTTDGLSHL